MDDIVITECIMKHSLQSVNHIDCLAPVQVCLKIFIVGTIDPNVQWLQERCGTLGVITT